MASLPPAHGAVRPGDADENDVRDTADVGALIGQLFDEQMRTVGADTNADAAISAADLALMPALLLAPYWEARAALPGARQETGVAELDGLIYVAGGFDDGGRIVPTVEAYDPIADRWSAVASLPQALHHVPLAAVGGRVYALGGLRTGAFLPVASVYAYDPASDVWTTRAPLPAARGAGAAAVIDGLIYLAGGLRSGSIADFAMYDPAADQWTTVPSMPTARDHLGAAAINGVFYAVGGRAGQLFDRLEAYDPISNTWQTLAPMPTARGGLAVAAVHGRLFAIGGEGNRADPLGIFPQTEAYDADTDTWEILPDMRTPRHGTGAAAVHGRIVVPGGATVQGFGASAANEALLP
jgi:N-acetylneuraminic acid mutarotase